MLNNADFFFISKIIIIRKSAHCAPAPIGLSNNIVFLHLFLVFGESGNVSDRVWLVGKSDGLVLSYDQLLLGGEGGEVHLGAGEGHGGEEEDTSYGLHHLKKRKNSIGELI